MSPELVIDSTVSDIDYNSSSNVPVTQPSIRAPIVSNLAQHMQESDREKDSSINRLMALKQRLIHNREKSRQALIRVRKRHYEQE